MDSIDRLSDTIKPNSQQLNADDLVAGPITVTVMGVSRGDTKEQPVSVAIDGGRQPYKPCKTMRRVLIAVWGDDGRAWVGKRMTLYCDPGVMFGGVKVGGIRISHMSGLDGKRSFMLTTTRSKRSEYTVQPLQSDDTDAKAKDLLKAINGAEDMDELKGAYSEAVKFAKDAKNATLAAEFAAAKDARKAQLPQQPEQQ